MDNELHDDYNPLFHIDGLHFRWYTSDDLRAISVKKITNTETFDNLNHPTIGGLYDPVLGPSEQKDVCCTCNQVSNHCPGHMGHIELALPVFNPLLFSTMYQTLKATCFYCHRLVVDPIAASLFLSQCRLLNRGMIAESAILSEKFADEDKSENRTGHKEMIEELANILLTERVAGTEEDHDVYKNVEAARQQTLANFSKFQLKKHTKCVHCSSRLRKIREEDKSKIFVVGKHDETGVSTSSSKSKTNSVPDSNNNSDNGDDTGNSDTDSNDQPKKKRQKLHVMNTSTKSGKPGEVTMLTPLKIKEHYRQVWKADQEILRELYSSLKSSGLEYPTDLFFLDVMPVPPTRFRPISELKDLKYEHPQTGNLLKILKDNTLIHEVLWDIEKTSANTAVGPGSFSRELNAIPGKTLFEKLNNAHVKLQASVNRYVDSDSDKSVIDSKVMGIKQILEKKEGLFRKNMMGKRVNFAARSVISPDPNINTNEIGIPMVFAKVLTYPTPVTPWNVNELRQAVINGPDVYPGATQIIKENGMVMRIDPKNSIKRTAMANALLTPSETDGAKPITGTKKVLRHLKNGDVLLINRQPTLHKPSIQAHKARVLTGEKTLRLHYANCKAYNADFDGDEMNAHFPQNEIARAEAYNIACTDYQYLVPKDGTPLAGLLQDHMVSGVSLTIRGRFFNRQDYCRLVYGALVDKPGRLKLLPPTILKPCKLWSGKQVLSTVVLNIIPEGKPALSLTGKAKVPEKVWIKAEVTMPELSKYSIGESDVYIRQGELLCGVLDKGHYGPTPYGLVHCCYELYGGPVAGQMLTCFGRLFMNFLQWRGFTLGVEDILVTKRADKRRKTIVKKSPNCGVGVAAKTFNLDPRDIEDTKIQTALMKAHFTADQQQMRELDMNMRNNTNTIQNDIVNVCMQNGLEKLFPYNNLQLMVQSGAKGSMVNCMQISCLLGQIELEGKRPPLMLSGKTLPSFVPYDVTPKAGGFVTGRFLTGIRQQEYFFHCMAGREGLVDTAVKTSRSGYLQRCLIKHLEGIKVNYDLTVRDADKSIIQFYYGEDSMDIHKTGFLDPKQLPFLVENHAILTTTDHKLENQRSNKKIRNLEKKIEKWHKKHGTEGGKVRKSGFLSFCQIMDVPASDNTERVKGRQARDVKLCNMWKNLSEKERKGFCKNEGRCPDPVMTHYRPYKGRVLPEKLDQEIKKFAKHNAKKMPLSEETFCELMCDKLHQSVAEPGEPVGLLSAQSIGEPSTQMTLNTFHFAGRGEMNVTLGIPRLREVLMVGSKNIKTPAMDVPVFAGQEIKDKAKVLQKQLTKVFLNELLKDVQVVEWLAIKNKLREQRRRMFKIRFTFLPGECYTEKFIVTPNQILRYMEKVYIKKLLQLIRKKINAQAKKKLLASARKRKALATDNDDDDENIPQFTPHAQDDDDEEEIDADDGDDTAADQKRKKVEEHEYEDEEEGEESADKGGAKDANEEEDPDEDDVEMDEADDSEMEDIEETLIQEYETKDRSSVEARINAVVQLSSEIDSYKFDVKKKQWCELILSFPLVDSKIDLLAIIEKDVQRIVVHEVPGISRCIMGEEKGPMGMELHLKTEGINMMELYKYNKILDVNRLYCNSIHHVAETYGIEAASKAIIKEVENVFAAYGIQVDYRHLSLIADYMTFEGEYKPFNRRALSSNASPLQKMSFESTMTFILSSVVNNSIDKLQSPSAQIVVGKNVTTGTGCLELLSPLCV